MTCPKCQGFILSTYDESYCLNCGYRVGTPVPAFQPKPTKQRMATEHQCHCGRTKVPWRSCCRGCLLRKNIHNRVAIKVEQERNEYAMRKEFGG